MRVALKVDDESSPGDEGTIESIPPGGSRSLALFGKLRSGSLTAEQADEVRRILKTAREALDGL